VVYTGVSAEVPLSLLVVDDDAGIRRVFSEVLSAREKVEVFEAASGEEALGLLRRRSLDVAFVDVRMPGLGGLDLLVRVRQEQPNLEIVIVTAFATVESAVQAMKLGASDYLSKPFKLDQVSLILSRLRKVKALRSENERLRRELQGRYSVRNLVGTAPAMERCNELVDRVRREDCNVLIQGESGTGKDLVARAIHYDGARGERLFIPIDCAAIQASLFESELFGHEKGAFTGAHARKAGLFEIASGGTAFLDEIGEIPLELQAVLLRAIEEKKIRPVGATEYKSVDVRIVSATNRSLEDMVDQGTFRRDLFYRINVVTIRIPPLRERKDDIPLLVDHFLGRYASREGARKVRGVSREALHILQRYDWPGNVRELEHVVGRACTLGRGEYVQIADLSEEVVKAVETKSRTPIPGRSFRDMEIEAILRLLKEHRGDTAKVSEILGIDRSTLYRKIKRYHINWQEDPSL
jgi:DNA-binding NtrC family response regulator